MVQGAFAQDDFDLDLFALSPEQLFDATVIAASRSSESIWDTPAAVYVITGEDIARSGVTSIPEALRLAPGVQVARINASGWAVSIRGFNLSLANKLLVMIDGREVYDPLYSGVGWDIQDTALEDIERIEIVRGPGASLWGANAVNGVVNIVTKAAADTQGGLLSVAAGDQERGVVTARYGGALGDSAHWRAYGRYTDRASQETLTGADALDEWETWRGGFRLDAAAGMRDTFTLQGDAYHSESAQFRVVAQRTAPYATLVLDETIADGGNLLGRWTRELDNDSRLTGQLVLDVTSRDQFTLRDERVTYDADAQYELPALGAHKLIVGGRYRNTNAEFGSTAVTAILHPTRRDQLYSAFVQDQITLVPDRLRLTLGSKIEHNDYTGVEIQPNARLQWIDGERQSAWASVGRAVRTPTVLEHEFTSILVVFPPGPLPVPIEIDLVANPDFESEELLAYEAGYRRRFSSDVEMDLAVFFNDYDGIGTASRMTPTFVANPLRIVQDVLLTNMTTAETYGFESVLNWRAADGLAISANYSFLDMELVGPGPEEAFGSEAAEGRSPRHQAGLRGQWDASSRLALDGALFYVGELPTYDVDSYLRFDARAGWRLSEDLELEVIGQNLFDDAHREFTTPADVNATQIERSVFGRLTWRP